MLMVVAVLEQFALHLLMKHGIMEKHIETLRHLVLMIDLLRMGDALLDRADEIRNVIKTWHTSLVELYPAAVKNKVHYMRHFVDDMLKHGLVLNCFRGERGLRVPKQRGSRAFKNFVSTLTSHVLNEFINGVSNGFAFFECGVDGKLWHRPSAVPTLQWLGRVCDVYESKKAYNPKGSLSKDDFVIWAGSDGLDKLGIVSSFALLKMESKCDELYAQVKLARHANGAIWSAAADEGRTLVPLGQLHKVVVVRIGDCVHVRQSVGEMREG